MVARIEARVGDQLAAPTQNTRFRHLGQQQSGQDFADTDDAEQQVTSAAQFNVRKLPRAAPDERNVLTHQAVAEK